MTDIRYNLQTVVVSKLVKEFENSLARYCSKKFSARLGPLGGVEIVIIKGRRHFY